MTFILFIEDQDELREEISEALELEDYKVAVAANGREGVKKAHQLLPDLIVCDINMPDLDGYAVLDAVRQNPQTATTPFLFLTGKSSRQEMRTGIERGADDYLTKPFETDELINAVEALLQKRSTLEKAFQQQLDILRLSISQVLPHELRTPLISVISYGDLLQRYPSAFGEDDLRQIGETLASSGERLQRLIENYLLYSQLILLQYQPEKLHLLRQERVIYPADTIREAAQKYATQYKRPDDLHMSLQNSHIFITDTHLRKLVDELIDNAFKFSEAGKTITISSCETEEDYQITIHNYGRGMKPEQIKKIGAFVQFDRPLYEQQGSGLGLAIVQLILSIYNGRFHIDSTHDEFIEVVVELPRQIEEAS